jgi:hypothetical protein
LGDVARIAAGIFRSLEDKTERGRRTASRLAVETWLKKENLMVVTKGAIVLPNSATEVFHSLVAGTLPACSRNLAKSPLSWLRLESSTRAP